LDSARREGKGVPSTCFSLRTTLDSIVAVAVMWIGGSISWLGGSAHGRSLAVAATIVLGALVARWLALRTQQRDLCLELVIAGEHSHEGFEELERECRRLRDPRFQAKLANTLDRWATAAAHPHAPLERHRPIYNRRVVRAMESQLRDLAVRLRAGGAELRGVAFVHRLLTAGSSPLYGKRVEPLRADLARARHLLG
jgi:hypothetical protein